jgi:hypothetical protein
MKERERSVPARQLHMQNNRIGFQVVDLCLLSHLRELSEQCKVLRSDSGNLGSSATSFESTHEPVIASSLFYGCLFLMEKWAPETSAPRRADGSAFRHRRGSDLLKTKSLHMKKARMVDCRHSMKFSALENVGDMRLD